VLDILWKLGNEPEILHGARDLTQKGQLKSDKYKNLSKPSAVGSVMSFDVFRVMQPNPIQQAASRYMHDHGVRPLNSAIKGLVQYLFAG